MARWQDTVQIAGQGWTAILDSAAIAEDHAWRLTTDHTSETMMLFREEVHQAAFGSFSPGQPLEPSSCIYSEAHLLHPH